MHVPTWMVRDPRAPLDLLRTWKDKETMERNYINMQREKLSIQGEQKQRRLDVGGVNNR